MSFTKLNLFFIAAILSFLLYSCHSHTADEEKEKDIVTSHKKEGYSGLLLKDSLVIEKEGDNFQSKISFFNGKDGYNLAVFKPKMGGLTFIDLGKNKQKKISGLPRYRANYCITAQGLIYGLGVDKNKIVRYNSEGVEMKTFNLTTVSLDKTYSFWSEASSVPFFVNSKNEIIVWAAPVLYVAKPDERTLYYKTKTMAVFQVQKDTIVLKDEFAKYGKEYTEHFYGNNQQPPATYKTDEIISYIFNTKPVIYEYNLQTKVCDEKPIKGLESNNLADYAIEGLSNISYTKQYATENNLYNKLLFDEKANRYVIIKSLKTNYTDKDGLLVEYYDKEFEIMVVNAQTYTVEKKYRVKNNSIHFFYQSFFYKGLLYVPRLVNNDEEPITIDIYEI
jgi:hypothetical protein